MKNKFKDKYENYFNSVNKLIPGFKPYVSQKQSKVNKDIKEAYRSEKRTFQAISSIMLMILLIFILINS